MTCLNWRRPRWPFYLVAALLATAAVGADLRVSATEASFADREYASASVASAWYEGVTIQHYLPAVGTLLHGSDIWVWGYRDKGLTGDGVSSFTATNAGPYPANRVTLPGGRIPDLVTGGAEDSVYPDLYTGLAALATDGTVWVWGEGDSNRRAGVPAATATTFATPTRVCFALAGTAATGRTACPNEAAEPFIVDLKSTDDTFIALSRTGDLYTWGGGQGRSNTGQGSTYYAAWPRRILSGVHSFGTTVWSAWAAVTDGWQAFSYSATDTVLPDDATVTASAAGTATIVFWGAHQASYTGGARGDASAVGTVTVPTPVSATLPANAAWPDGTLVTATAGQGAPNPMIEVFNALKTVTDCADPAVPKGDNCVGVRQGASDDGGVFQQMIGHYYGNQFVVRDGSILLWGATTSGGAWGGNGLGLKTDEIKEIFPVRVALKVDPDYDASHGASGTPCVTRATATAGSPMSAASKVCTGFYELALNESPADVAGGVRVTKVAASTNLVLLLDDTHTVWIYGERGTEAEPFPLADGSPAPSGTADQIAMIRVAGTDANGWRAGSIADAAGQGWSFMVVRTDSSVWFVGGYNVRAGCGNANNCARQVRTALDGDVDNGGHNTITTYGQQPLTRLDLTYWPA